MVIQGKSRNIHGYNYSFSIELCCDTLDSYGMVLDFEDIEKIFSEWINENWDHKVIVSNLDKSFVDFLNKEKIDYFLVNDLFEGFETNITIEWMSHFLFDKFKKILEKIDNCVKLISVSVHQDNNGYANYSE